jgi:hypothetical protein
MFAAVPNRYLAPTCSRNAIAFLTMGGCSLIALTLTLTLHYYLEMT